MKKLLAALILPTLAAASLTSIAAPGAEAATRSPRVGLHTSTEFAFKGAPVLLSGRAKGPIPTRTALLERYTTDGWKVIDRDALNAGRGYRFRVKPAVGTHTYRVSAVLRSGRILHSGSQTITVEPIGELQEVQTRILRETNQYRASRGLPPLKPMASLDQLAQAWTVQMARTDDFKHNPNVRQQMPGRWWAWGENIALGYDVEDVTQAWWESPGHRDNMLGDYTHLGIGYAENDRGWPYYTQTFGKY